VRGNITAMAQKDEQNVNILMNMHHLAVMVIYAMKLDRIQEYNRNMGYVKKSHQMTNSYCISRGTFQWTKKLFFHLLDLTTLNTSIILTPSFLSFFLSQSNLFYLLSVGAEGYCCT
jgi:hypothetical protein